MFLHVVRSARDDRDQDNVHTLLELLPSVSRTLWTVLVAIDDNSFFHVAKTSGRGVRMLIVPTFFTLSRVTTFAGRTLHTAHGF
jgi:hypothetical protein